MSIDDRVDPVQIIARVGAVTEELSDPDRGFEVWMYLAHKAGWSVAEVPGEPHDKNSRAIAIEGIRYRLRYGLRVRSLLVDDSTGHMTRRPVLCYAAWAEPDLDAYDLENLA